MLCGTVVGLFSWVYGGLDVILSVLITCVVIDYISGICAAVYTGTLNSQTGFKGILKKVVILLIVALGSLIGQALGNDTIRGFVIGFYIANEGISILENAGRMNVPIAKNLAGILEQLKTKNEKEIEIKK